MLPRGAPVCQGRAGWPGLGAVRVTATLSTSQERGQQCPGMSLQLGMSGCLCHSLTRVEVGAGLGMQQGPCAEAPALQGRGAAVPAEAAARARAIGGGPRTGTCWIYGPSHDVFMAGMGQPQMLPSPALPGTARHGTSGPRSASWCRQGGGFQMDFALRGGAPRGSPWHRCRVCPLPGSSTAPSLPAPQAGTWCGGRNLSVLSRPVLSGPGAALVLSPSRLPPQSRYADPLPLPHIQGWSWAGVCSHSSPVPSAGSREA